MEQQYEQIEAYLDGTLSGAELEAFEAELKRNMELAAEVALHRRLQHTLGNTDEWAFRQNLEAISKAYQAPDQSTTPDKQGTNRLFLGILGLLVVASLLYYFFIMAPATPSAPSPGEEQNAPSVINEEPEPTNEAPVEDTIQATPELPEEKAPPVANTPTDQPNAALEALVTASPLNSAFELAIEARLIDIGFTLQGQMLSAQYEADQQITIALFDNLPANYPNAPLHTGELQVVKAEEDAPIAFAAKEEYFLAYEAELNLATGLYYYVINIDGEPEALWVGKVER